MSDHRFFGVGGAVCEAPELCRCGKVATVWIGRRAANPFASHIEALCEEHAAKWRAYQEWAERNPVIAAEVAGLEVQAAEMDRWPAFTGGPESAEANRQRAAELRTQHGCPE